MIKELDQIKTYIKHNSLHFHLPLSPFLQVPLSDAFYGQAPWPELLYAA